MYAHFQLTHDKILPQGYDHIKHFVINKFCLKNNITTTIVYFLE